MAKKITPITVQYIVTHHGFHPDEALPAWMLQRFGEDYFPGISDAEFIFVDAGTVTYQDKDWKQLEREGYLMLGVGHGRFDHHQDDANPNECTATLVAKHLGLDQEPAFERILGYVKANDLKGSGASTDLADRLRVMHRAGWDPIDILNTVYEELDLTYDDEKANYEEALEAFGQAKFELIKLPSGKTLKVAIVESDSQMIGRVTRSMKHGQNVAVLIQKRSTGGVYIAPVPRLNLNLSLVAGIVRKAEAVARKIQLTQAGEALCVAGRIEEVPQWYFFDKNQSLMNGSLTTQEVEPTILHLDTIFDLVKRGLVLNETLEDVEEDSAA